MDLTPGRQGLWMDLRATCHDAGRRHRCENDFGLQPDQDRLRLETLGVPALTNGGILRGKAGCRYSHILQSLVPLSKGSSANDDLG